MSRSAKTQAEVERSGGPLRGAVLLALALLIGFGTPTSPRASERRTAVVEAVEKASAAVVNISTEQIVEAPFGGLRGFSGDPFFDQFFRDFFEYQPRRRLRQSSLGSGVIVRPNGYIVTNEHVIVRASKITVTLSDNRSFDATLVGADSDSDLALLRVDAGRALPYISLDTVQTPMIGETAIAIGNPFGLSHTVTVGVVSALNRSIKTDERTYYDFIQTDASINPGNSGGPLLNLDGELIGINTAIYSKAEGIGFAIPAARARRIVNDLIAFGEVHTPWVGAIMQEITPQIAAYFGLRQTGGALVSEVESESPAERAGIERGDIVAAVGEHAISSVDSYLQRIRDYREGEEIPLTIIRDGRTRRVTVKSAAFPTERADRIAWQRIGISVKSSGGGLVIARVRAQSPAAAIGVRPGDLLVGLAGTTVKSVAEFRRKVAQVRGQDGVLLSIARGARIYHVVVPMAGTG